MGNKQDHDRELFDTLRATGLRKKLARAVSTSTAKMGDEQVRLARRTAESLRSAAAIVEDRGNGKSAGSAGKAAPRKAGTSRKPTSRASGSTKAASNASRAAKKRTSGGNRKATARTGPTKKTARTRAGSRPRTGAASSAR